MGPALTSLDEVIAEMLMLQKAIPKRPSFPELEIAVATIAKIDETLAASQTELLQQQRPDDVPVIVFSAFQEMRLEAAEHRAKEQKQVAVEIVELEERHRKYDMWIRKVHTVLSSGTVEDLDADADVDADAHAVAAYADSSEGISERTESKDAQGSARSVLDATWDFPPSESDSFSRVAHSLSWNKEHTKTDVFSVDGSRTIDESNILASDNVKKTASLVNMLEASSKEKQTCLDLRGALLKEIEWVPESIGKMTWLMELNLSGNRLTKLPDSVGDLVNLVNMDVSLNQLTVLPETIGRLTCLKTLILDNNKFEELSHTIGQCTALIELSASFNQLKALPEATGKLTQLHSLDVHFNKLGSLPTTIASMAGLVDLDASFNEIHRIPEGLCQVTTLTRLNLSSNFNELQELPPGIGNLQKLKVLNLSCNQLKVLPDSFALLTNLQDLDLSGNPLRVPPKHIADQGTEAILKYMADCATEREKGKVVVHKNSIWTLLFCSCGKPSAVEADLAVG
ncbi:hypothetical protein GOP47_0023028 [Adiantum capillus-veneris]|uniref:Uncharacterized protein n=1 Tax=Adiantum capillus-veneris TaxID=13818 RepID=A0A9D4U8G9_ADICA|nr:hypothetical protein GOP47_0023028 [Adiantum capillus-veneris]